MTTTAFTGREFSQAKKASRNGPVFITERGRPCHVLLTIEAYRELTGSDESIADLLALPEAAEIDFDPPRLDIDFRRPTDKPR